MPYEKYFPGPENLIDFTDLKDLSQFKENLRTMGIFGESKERYISNSDQKRSGSMATFNYEVLTGKITEELIKEEMGNEERMYYDNLGKGHLETGKSGLPVGGGANVGSIDTLDKYGKVIANQISRNVDVFGMRERTVVDERGLQEVTAELLYSLEVAGHLALADGGDPEFAKREEALRFAQKALDLTGYLDEHPDSRDLIDYELSQLRGKSEDLGEHEIIPPIAKKKIKK